MTSATLDGAYVQHEEHLYELQCEFSLGYFYNFYTQFFNKNLFYSIFVGDPVSCKWKIMPQKLKVGRNQAVMMQLSTGFSCNNPIIDVV